MIPKCTGNASVLAMACEHCKDVVKEARLTIERRYLYSEPCQQLLGGSIKGVLTEIPRLELLGKRHFDSDSFSKLCSGMRSGCLWWKSETFRASSIEVRSSAAHQANDKR